MVVGLTLMCQERAWMADIHMTQEELLPIHGHLFRTLIQSLRYMTRLSIQSGIERRRTINGMMNLTKLVNKRRFLR